MKKYLIRMLTLLLATTVFCGCSQTKSAERTTYELDQSQLRNICQMNTYEVLYENVAKHYQEDTSGWGPWSKDTHFWIPYQAYIECGIDANELGMEVTGTTVTITLPEAKILAKKVIPESISQDTIKIEENTTPPDVVDLQLAKAKADEDLEKSLQENNQILTDTLESTKAVLADYINQIGELKGIDYTIKWKYTNSAQESLEAEYLEA